MKTFLKFPLAAAALAGLLAQGAWAQAADEGRGLDRAGSHGNERHHGKADARRGKGEEDGELLG